jgi:hypothetical protein
MGSDIPTQVRVRTDPDEDLGYRYDAIQSAKRVFDEGSMTGAIVAACDHAAEDRRAKEKVVERLAEEVDVETLAEVVELLSTSRMFIEFEIRGNEGRSTVEVRI